VSLAVLAVVASAVVGDGTAIALDDGTVWMVYDGEWEELGACDDGAVTALDGDAGELAIECGDGSRWWWSPGGGWLPVAPYLAAEPTEVPGRSWWPLLEISVRSWRDEASPVHEAWVRLRWNL
jgi:hypothetical protein